MKRKTAQQISAMFEQLLVSAPPAGAQPAKWIHSGTSTGRWSWRGFSGAQALTVYGWSRQQMKSWRHALNYGAYSNPLTASPWALGLDKLWLELEEQMNKRRRNLPDSKMLLAQLASTRVTKLGIAMLETPGGYMLDSSSVLYRTQHEALREWLKANPRAYGWKGQHYILRRGVCQEEPMRLFRYVEDGKRPHWRGWFLVDPAGNEIARWLVRPKRDVIAACIRKARSQDSRPSWKRPDTLGWRGWRWDTRKGVLVSPHQGTPWPDRECRVENWSESAAVRGHAGIHACRLPRGDWRTARRPSDMMGNDIIGLVERFGRFVLGSEGWRAEWVIIKELMAPDESTASAVRAAYPDIPVSVAPNTHWLHNFI